MFINLFSLRSLGLLLYVLLLNMSLEGSDLLVDPGNVLLNYVRQFLSLQLLLDESPGRESLAYANFHGTIVKQGLPFSNLQPSVNGEE